MATTVKVGVIPLVALDAGEADGTATKEITWAHHSTAFSQYFTRIKLWRLSCGCNHVCYCIYGVE